MKIIREIIKDNNLEILDSLAYKSITNIKNHIPNKDLTLKEEVETAIIFKKLQTKLREINRMDFDDILYYYYELIQSNDYYLESMQDYFQYVLIDEAQDINEIQY